MDNPPLGLAHFWHQADAISRGVAYLLLLMSICSWYTIFWRALQWWRLKRAGTQVVEVFWQSKHIEEGLQALRPRDPMGFFVGLAQAAHHALGLVNEHSLSAGIGKSEQVTRALRFQLSVAARQLERGLTLLASIGSTAPFIGLFGTVWGIYHALIHIASTGQIQIDKIAGPVGEALVMTAAGLAVAIPAVVAYNAFLRANRVFMAELDGFAHDLHALLTAGQRRSAKAVPDAHRQG